MGRNLIFGAIILIIVSIAGSFLLLEGALKQDWREAGSADAALAPVSARPDPELEDADGRERRAAMRAEYDRLEQAREALRKRLGRLNARLWKLRLPPEQVRAIQKRMQQGHALLKNPPLLGAFSGADEINVEINRVRQINDRLKMLEAEVEQRLAEQPSR